MMRPYGWRFNVFFDNGDGDGAAAAAAATAAANAAATQGTGQTSTGMGGGGAPAGTSTDAASAPGGLSGLASGVADSLSGSTSGGSSGGAAVGSHGTQGAGPSGGGGGGGGGVGGTGGGVGGTGGTGGSAGGVGGGGHGVASTLAALLGQLQAGGQGPPSFGNLGVPAGVGGQGAAPVSPVTKSSLAQTISSDPSVANSPLGILALAALGQLGNPFGVMGQPGGLGNTAFGPLGNLAPGTNMGYPSLEGASPGLGGFGGNPASPGPTPAVSVRGPGSDTTAPVSTYGNMPGVDAFDPNLGTLRGVSINSAEDVNNPTLSPADVNAINSIPGLNPADLNAVNKALNNMPAPAAPAPAPHATDPANVTNVTSSDGLMSALLSALQGSPALLQLVQAMMGQPA